jgi:hypothetical protein
MVVPGMRLSWFLVIAAFATLLVAPSTAESAETISTTVTVVAEFSTVTSLRVSSQTLQFAATQPDGPAVAVVDFAAGARTRQGGEVMLSVERVAELAPDEGSEVAVTFTGEGAGLLSGTLASTGTTPVARWTGSGLRTGRLTFSLPQSAGPPTLPVRFVLSAP